MKDIILKIMGNGVTPKVPCADGSCNEAGAVGAILGYAYLVIGIVAVIIIIIAGIQYMTSEGEPERTKKAQATITYTVIGLIIATAAAAMIYFVTGAFE